MKKPLVLIILDGWGYRENPSANAIYGAHTPTWDKLWQQAPHTLIDTSGLAVGLPDGQMGNSEVGHMNLGAGRVVYQSLTRINKAINDQSFFDNEVLLAAVDKAIAANKAVHLMGLLSPGGIHSHEDHIHAMIDLASARGAKSIYVHAFLDGRDMPPRSANNSLQKLENKLQKSGLGRIVSIVGRYYAMDRDQRWDRIQSAYELLTEAKAPFTASSPEEALQQAYARNESDEFVQATVIKKADSKPVCIEDGDSVIFMNFRADRARQLTRTLVDPLFSNFQRHKHPKLSDFVMLTQYDKAMKTSCAYPPENMSNVLGEYLAKQGKSQLRLAETEKYAHVTFFFSGGLEQAFENETRLLIPSPKVKTYDLKPEMSAPEVTKEMLEAINKQQYDVIICNYANGDMVGHTGNYQAAVQAAEIIDQCLTQITSALATVGGECLITADHGNIEKMHDESSNQAHTAHTCGPVPLVYVGNRKITLAEGGALSDVAPTLLHLLDLEKPAEMTGNSLICMDLPRD